MRFTETEIAGVVIVELEPIEDDRGWFAAARTAATSSSLTVWTRRSCSATCRSTATPARSGACTTRSARTPETKLVRCVQVRSTTSSSTSARIRRRCSGTSRSSSRARPTAPCTSRRVSPTASRRSWTTPKSNTVWALRTRRRQGGAYDSTIRRSGCAGRSGHDRVGPGRLMAGRRGPDPNPARLSTTVLNRVVAGSRRIRCRRCISNPMRPTTYAGTASTTATCSSTPRARARVPSPNSPASSSRPRSRRSTRVPRSSSSPSSSSSRSSRRCNRRSSTTRSRSG